MFFEEKKEPKLKLSKQRLAAISKALSKSKYLSPAQRRELMLYLKKTKTLVKEKLYALAIPRQLSKKILADLLRCGLTRLQILSVMKFIKLFLKNLFSKPFDRMALGELKRLWHLLPPSLKSLLIAFQVMKDELIHQHILMLQKLNKNSTVNKKVDVLTDHETIEEQRKKFFPETARAPSGNFFANKNTHKTKAAQSD